RTIQKQGCPYCSGRRVLKGENDILTTHAHLQDAWADHRNIDEFSFGSNYKATWKCTQDENHTWTAIIDDVSSGRSNCPHCSNSVSKAEKELLEYVESLGFEAKSDRKILKGKELDIFIPEKNVAIEYN